VLLVVAVGVVLVAAHQNPDAEPGSGVRSAVLAIPVALSFGLSLYTTGCVGSDVLVLQMLVSAQLFEVVFLAAPRRRATPRTSTQGCRSRR
jgi:hypothetical protein